MIGDGRQKIEGLEVIGPRFLWPSGFALNIAQVHQSLSDGAWIGMIPLKRENLPIIEFCLCVVSSQRADIPKVSERVDKVLRVALLAIVLESAFVPQPRLFEVATVQIDSRPMFVAFRHVGLMSGAGLDLFFDVLLG